MLAVAVVEEAIDLREAGITAPILILGKTWDCHLSALFKYDLHPVAASLDDIEQLGKAAKKQKTHLPVHLKIDTGMGRLGFLYNDYKKGLTGIAKHPWLNLAGIMSHLATADEPEGPHVQIQMERFQRIYQDIRAAFPSDPPLFHLGNSAGSLYLSGIGYDRVRLGLSMYGMPPSTSYDTPFPLQQIMRVNSRVAYVKKFPAGYPIGYGSSYHTTTDSTILVCSGGYEDGIPRRYGNAGEVLIHGKRFPIVGNVSMDTFMVDVTSEPVEIGEEVVLLGDQGADSIPITEMAQKLGVIPYEITCGISNRVGREFVDQD